MIKPIVVSLCTFLLFACTGNKKQEAKETDNKKSEAKAMLQGVWIDDDTDTPLLYVKGDTIYYTDPQTSPVYFDIRKDTLYLHSQTLASYRIDRQTEFSFWFHTDEDNAVKLHKSENPSDTLAFPKKNVEVIPVYTSVTKKDSVVMHKGTRYRAYVHINPSKMKVVRTTHSDEGISIDNVYYDNVMHICVYEGRKCLYDSNITKQMFAEVLPDDLLSKSILMDMNFIKVDDKGFHYQAAVSLPGSTVSNMVNLLVSWNWKLTITAG